MQKLFELDKTKFMGAQFAERFDGSDLPYLFKVLSVRTALSI
jgi:mannose-6-phosphate isomerase class I